MRIVLINGNHRSLLFRVIMVLALNVVAGLGDVSLSSVHAESELSSEPIRADEKNTLGDRSVTADGDWPMVAANVARTSWTSEEVRGALDPLWYRVIEPYIPPKTQIIAANGLLYISTSGGLYALDADTGQTAWVYPTALPLGNSPTIHHGIAYVGGLDHRLHAVDAHTGEAIWTFEAKAGFETNPLVLELDGRTLIYVGNRDGCLYAIEDQGSNPSLYWKYETDGPIHFSAAYAEGAIYFASNDSHAYAIDASTGSLVWKSDKLPGGGFEAFWPVVYSDTESGDDVLILAGSTNYRFLLEPAYGYDQQNLERDDIFPDRQTDPRGTLVGPLNPDGTVGATRILEYLEAKPWRRTYLVLHRLTGQEVTFDFDNDDKPEYAPVLWHGTHSGNRYPPVIGSDGLLYQSNTYMSSPSIQAGQVSGWKYGDPNLVVSTPTWKAMDEPLAYSAGGDIIYWNHCNDRSAGAFDISISNDRFFPDAVDPEREWLYFSAVGLVSRLPGYNALYEAMNPNNYGINNLFRSTIQSSNGVYGQHGYQNPPIPYAGKVYMHRSNAVIAFADYDGPPIQVPMAEAEVAPRVQVAVGGPSYLRQRLADEVSKIVNAGHLRPGYRSNGLMDNPTRDRIGDYLIDYWHNTSDIIYALSQTLPYLPTDLQEEVKLYLQTEFENYPPYIYTHVGWKDGAPREAFMMPQETEADRVNHPPDVSGYGYEGWTWPPNMFYALWKYAEIFGDASDIFEASRSRLESPPSDSYLIEYPYVLNVYIAGYLGYLELESLAGHPESSDIRAELDRLLALRITSFSKDTPVADGNARRALGVARNFMFMVPELGHYMHEHINAEVQAAIDEYSEVAPYWFVTGFNATHGEAASQHLFDSHALFQARARILQEPGSELVKYLDVPAMQVGDLYYIENLVALIEAGVSSSLEKTAVPRIASQGGLITYTLSFSGYDSQVSIVDYLPEGVSAPFNFGFSGTTAMPTYDPGTHQLNWIDQSLEGELVTISYTVSVISDGIGVLKNIAELTTPDEIMSSAEATVSVNYCSIHLPLVLRTR